MGTRQIHSGFLLTRLIVRKPYCFLDSKGQGYRVMKTAKMKNTPLNFIDHTGRNVIIFLPILGHGRELVLWPSIK